MPKKKPWNKELRKVWCDFCDGCGWYEGGRVIKTSCGKCKGSGKVWPRQF